MTHDSWRSTYSNNNAFLIWNERPEGGGTAFPRFERKELSNANAISGENIPQNKKEIKTFSNEEKLKECVACKSIPKEWLKEVFQTERIRR